MADILIRGMEMPNCCALCDLEHWDEDSYGDEMNHRCFAYYNGYTVNVRDCGRLPGCPLLPLPKGHGRLGDLDALAAQFKQQIVNEDDLMELCKRAGLMSNYFDESKVQIGMVTFMRMLNDAKTIVPAEGGGEE